MVGEEMNDPFFSASALFAQMAPAALVMAEVIDMVACDCVALLSPL